MRPFVARFLLPLVKGGRVRVGRPLTGQDVDALAGAVARESDSVAALAQLRRAEMARHLPFADPPVLDEDTLRIGAAIHNLLVLSHPRLAAPRLEARRARIVNQTLSFLRASPPASPSVAVARHSLFVRLPELRLTETEIGNWLGPLGRRRFVGRVAPERLMILPKLRRVTVDRRERLWLREIGIAPEGRPLWNALQLASPLGEALDPVRLEPPAVWERMLLVMRFPVLGRLIADRILELGLRDAGEALAVALHRWAARRDVTAGVAPTESAVAFALRFLAHVVWVDTMFPEPSRGAPGPELGALLLALSEGDGRFLLPPDVRPDADVARSMRARLAEIGAAGGEPLRARLPAARVLCARARGEVRG